MRQCLSRRALDWSPAPIFASRSAKARYPAQSKTLTIAMTKHPIQSKRQAPHHGRHRPETWPVAGFALSMVGALLPAAQATASNENVALRNLTSAPITQVYISPAGQNTFGRDQIALIPGGEVDQGKVLKLTGIGPGSYLLRVTDNAGRVCWVRDVKLEPNEVVSVHDDDLTDCDP
jgi:hypothetical protein